MVEWLNSQQLNIPKGISNSQTILEKLDRIDDLPTLPIIAMEVNEVLNPKILDYNSIKIPLSKREKL